MFDSQLEILLICLEIVLYMLFFGDHWLAVQFSIPDLLFTQCF
jgi:hypothetical protein